MKIVEWVRRLITWIGNIGRPKAEEPAGEPFSARVMVPITNHDGSYIFYCPGCQVNHLVDTTPRSGAYHILTGTLEKPTVRASVLVPGDKRSRVHRCHAFITNGEIEYLSDSTHPLSGRTVKMEPL